MEATLAKTFTDEQFGKVRVLVINGKPYFAGKDVAQALGFKNTAGIIKHHVTKSDKILVKPEDLRNVNSNPITVNIPSTGMYFINESGLYTLVIRSRLPKAREFQHWLTSEVIPSIMEKGYYAMPGFEKYSGVRVDEDFSKREKVEILLKLLNMTNTPVLRNQIIRHIDLILSPEYEKLLMEIDE